MQEFEPAKVNIDAQNPDDKKKALIGNGILLFVLAVGIIIAIFAWFAQHDNKANVHGLHMVSADDLEVYFNTYPGTVQSNGEIAYDETKNLNDENFPEDLNEFVLFPGERKYFKTVISNYEERIITGDMALKHIRLNSHLNTTDDGAYISFSSNKEDGSDQQAFDLEPGTPVSGTPTTGEEYEVETQIFHEGITLEAATRPGGGNVRPTTVTIYWYVTLNGAMVDNAVMGEKMIHLESIRFIQASVNDNP